MLIRPAKLPDVNSIASLYVHNHRETYADLLPREYFEALTEDCVNNKRRSYGCD